MKTELIKEFEQKYERSRFLSDSGIGDMHSEQGCYCYEYVDFLEQKLANGVGQSTSNCNIPLVSNWVAITEAPPKNGYYLVVHTNNLPFVAMYNEGQWTSDLEKVKPTHWMHLPKTPCC